ISPSSRSRSLLLLPLAGPILCVPGPRSRSESGSSARSSPRCLPLRRSRESAVAASSGDGTFFGLVAADASQDGALVLLRSDD
ncbi:hypothetical protein IscW_ISCW008107, partial [Ixodes scapularis]